MVLAASYEAKALRRAHGHGRRPARRLCPDAVVVEPRMAAYAEASTAVFGVFDATTPLVEPLSIDEAFLEVGGLRRVAGTPVEIAARLRHDVAEQVGLAITVGVARTKFLAKVASRVAKPDGLLVVPPAGELAFLHPLPIDRLWGVGPVTAAKLHQRGLDTVGDVALVPEAALVAILGRRLRTPGARPGPQPRSRLVQGRPAAAVDRFTVGAGLAAAAPPTSTRCSSASSTGWPGGCGRPGGSAHGRRCACASPTSPGPAARTP